MADANGYLELVQSARALMGTEIFLTDDDPSEAAVDEYLAVNSKALDSARQALESPCRVPLQYVDGFFEKHREDVPWLVALGRSFRLESVAAARRGEVERAVRSGVSILELGDAARTGGLMVDLLAGNTLLDMGISQLRGLRGSLDFESCRALAREVLCIDARREPFEAVVERDDEWERRFPPDGPLEFDEIDWPEELDEEDELKHFFFDAIQEMAEKPREEQRHVEWKLDATNRGVLRLLAVELALQAYRAALGGFPDALDELVPGFLPEVPIDPCTCDPNASDPRPLRYRRQGDDYVLYSVGPSGEDCGGRGGSWWEVQSGGADLCSSVHDYPRICPTA